MLLRPRIVFADYMKAFSAAMVVLYHAAVQSDIKTIAYILCLPAFFLVAGMFSNTAMNPLQFFRCKSMRLLIPYICFGVFCWLIWLVVGRKYGSDADSAVSWWLPLVGILSGKVELLIQNRPLWFLCCMVCTEWIYYALCRIPYRSVRWLGALSIAVAGCILSLYGKTGVWEITAAMLVVPLYMIGAEGKELILMRFTALRVGTLLALLCMAMVGIGIGYYFNPVFHISTCQVGHPALFYLTALSVMLFWLTLAILLERMIGHIHWLEYIGQNTLIILCTHIPLFGFIKGICMVCHLSPSFFSTNIGSLALWASSLILLFPISYCINRYFPFLIGKQPSPLSVS